VTSTHGPQREPFEWHKLQKRLTQAAQSTRHAFDLPPERARAILEERARLLARVPSQAPAADDVLHVVTFALADERLAIPTALVCEVLRPQELTPVPGVPDTLVGLHNLRGQILPVFDLRSLFGLPTSPSTQLPWIVVLGRERPEAGIVADTVHDVATLRIDQILPAPAAVRGIARSYLQGVTADALLILAAESLLQGPLLTLDQGAEEKP
jgi:purine-binding chemotaxis protein CheW